MKVDRYLMKKAREVGKGRDSKHPNVGLREYLNEVRDVMRYSQTEIGPRKAAKFYLKEGRFSMAIGMKAIEYAGLGMAVFFAGLGMEYIGDKADAYIVHSMGRSLAATGVLGSSLGVPISMGCAIAFFTRRAINGFPPYERLKWKAEKQKKIVAMSEEEASERLDPNKNGFTLEDL